MKRIKIGIDEHRQKMFNDNLERIIALLKDLFNEVDTFITLKDKNILKGNIYNGFKDEFKQQYEGKFPEILSIEKCLELAEVNTDKIKYLEQQISKIDIDINYNTLKTKTPDFSIYIEKAEHLKLYDYMTRLSAVVNEGKQHRTFFFANIIQGTNQLLQYDWSKQEVKPNTRVITQRNY